jgi:hypothetical protein
MYYLYAGYFPSKMCTPVFFSTTSWSPVKICVWQVLVCDVSMMFNRTAFTKKKKNCMEKKKRKIAWKRKLHALIYFCFSGLLICFYFFRSKSGLHQFFWRIVNKILINIFVWFGSFVNLIWFCKQVSFKVIVLAKCKIV